MVIGKRDYLFFAVAAALVIADQIAKSFVRSIGDHVLVISGFFDIAYIKNTGATFGFFPGSSFVVAVFSVAVIIFFLVYYRKLPGVWYVTLGSGLILGGAIGNLIDRLFLGHVVDFIDFSFWPAFNIADSGIVVGTILVMFYFLMYRD